MAYVSSSRNHGNFLVARLGEMWALFTEGWKNYRVFRDTMNELEALSQRELSDLGIDRADIGRIAMDAAYGTNTMPPR